MGGFGSEEPQTWRVREIVRKVLRFENKISSWDRCGSHHPSLLATGREG